MLHHEPSPARAGRRSSVDHQQLLTAAAELADGSGLDSVTLRVLGERLGVSAMAVHRASGGIDALRHALVSTLVEEAIADLAWPDEWRSVVTSFGYRLRDLLLRHPLVLDAHRRAPIDAPGADDVAHRVVAALRTAGLSAEDAAYGYATVHDFVTGHVDIRLGRGEFGAGDIRPEERSASVFVDHHDQERRFAIGLELILAGLESLAGRPRGTAPGAPSS